ncbi:hypothetical protein V8F20_008924 [Naviculisporaceae sp. PSN 640]
MPVSTRSSRNSSRNPSRSSTPKPTARRAAKVAMRRSRVASDDEGPIQDTIVVHGTNAESESESDNDADNFVPPPRPAARRAAKVALRKRRVAADDEGTAKASIVVHSSDSESESDPDNDTDNSVPPPKPNPGPVLQPSMPRRLARQAIAKARKAKQATTEPPTTEPPITEPPTTEPPATEPPTTEPPTTDGAPLLTQSLTTDPIVSDIAINDLVPFVNRPASVRRAEQAKNDRTRGKALNGFFIYKIAYYNRIRKMQEILNAKTPRGLRHLHNYSRIAAASWKLESKEVKDFYTELSRIDEINRYEAFKDCREMVSKNGRAKKRDEEEDTDPSAPKAWMPQPRARVKSKQNKALPVGVVPGKDFTAADATTAPAAEGGNADADADYDVEEEPAAPAVVEEETVAPINDVEETSASVVEEAPAAPAVEGQTITIESPKDVEMSFGSPSLLLAPLSPGTFVPPTPGLDQAMVDAMIDEFTMANGPIIIEEQPKEKPVEKENEADIVNRSFSRAFFLAAEHLKEQTPTNIEEEMSHLALDDHERGEFEDPSHLALEEHEREHEEMSHLALEIHEMERHEEPSHWALDYDELEDKVMADSEAEPPEPMISNMMSRALPPRVEDPYHGLNLDEYEGQELRALPPRDDSDEGPYHDIYPDAGLILDQYEGQELPQHLWHLVVSFHSGSDGEEYEESDLSDDEDFYPKQHPNFTEHLKHEYDGRYLEFYTACVEYRARSNPDGLPDEDPAMHVPLANSDDDEEEEPEEADSEAESEPLTFIAYVRKKWDKRVFNFYRALDEWEALYGSNSWSSDELSALVGQPLRQ